MTTATRQDARRAGVRTVAWAALAALAFGFLTAVVGLLASGGPAGAAAVIGTLVVVVVLFSGALTVTIVADLMPSASLTVALMTYTLQMVLLAVVLIPLGRSDWADKHLDAPWLAAAVIGGALVWTACHVVLATRARIPIYDLPDTGGAHDSTATRPAQGSAVAPGAPEGS